MGDGNTSLSDDGNANVTSNVHEINTAVHMHNDLTSSVIVTA